VTLRGPHLGYRRCRSAAKVGLELQNALPDCPNQTEPPSLSPKTAQDFQQRPRHVPLSLSVSKAGCAAGKLADPHRTSTHSEAPRPRDRDDLARGWKVPEDTSTFTEGFPSFRFSPWLRGPLWREALLPGPGAITAQKQTPARRERPCANTAKWHYLAHLGTCPIRSRFR